MFRAAALAVIFATLTATAPANSQAPEVTEQSVAYAINVARAVSGEDPLAAQNEDLQELCESRAEAVLASGSPARAINGEAIGRAGQGATATDVVAALLTVEEYREALLNEDATQIGVAVETDEFGLPVVVVETME